MYTPPLSPFFVLSALPPSSFLFLYSICAQDLDTFWKEFWPENTGQKIKVVGSDTGLGAGVEVQCSFLRMSFPLEGCNWIPRLLA
jgi:hypothetical protein